MNLGILREACLDSTVKKLTRAATAFSTHSNLLISGCVCVTVFIIKNVYLVFFRSMIKTSRHTLGGLFHNACNATFEMFPMS